MVVRCKPLFTADFGARSKSHGVYGTHRIHAPIRIPQGLGAVYAPARKRASCVVSFKEAPALRPGVDLPTMPTPHRVGWKLKVLALPRRDGEVHHAQRLASEELRIVPARQNQQIPSLGHREL
jgi:hypothetical protein